MNSELEKFSKSIQPPRLFNQLACETTRDILLLLEAHTKYKFERFVVGGGQPEGKNTSTCLKCDVDLTIFVPFSSSEAGTTLKHYLSLKKELILHDWWRIIWENTVPDHWDDVIKRTGNSLNFLYKGIWFDILVAHDFTKHSHSLKNNRKRVLQLLRVTTRLLELPSRQYDTMLAKIPRKLQSELSYDGVTWMKSQPPHVADVARLAKFWSQTVLFVGNGSGKSFFIELIAVKAALDVEPTATYENRYEKCFKRFLELIMDVRNLRIIFNGSYREEEVPQSVLDQHPLLLNPVNPFQNLFAEVTSPHYLDVISVAARETLARFGLWNSRSMFHLFKPQIQSSAVILRNVVYKIVSKINGNEFMPTLSFNSPWIKPIMNSSLEQVVSDKNKYTRYLIARICRVIGSVVKCCCYEQEDGMILTNDDIISRVKRLLRTLSNKPTLTMEKIEEHETVEADVQYEVPLERGKIVMVMDFDVVVNVLCDDMESMWGHRDT